MGRPIGAHVGGPLQPLAGGFLSWLIELGYSWTAQTARLRLLGELSSWMAGRGIEAEELTAALMKEFLVGAPCVVSRGGVVLADVGAPGAGVLARAGFGGGAGGAGAD